MELFCDQKVFELDDYVRAVRAGFEKPLWSGAADKGHAAEIALLHAALRKRAANARPMSFAAARYSPERVAHDQCLGALTRFHRWPSADAASSCSR